MGLKSNRNNQFEKDYAEIIKKLQRLAQNSKIIKKVIEKKADAIEPDHVMVLLRGLIPETIRDLGQIYQFLDKYGYTGNVGEIQSNNGPKEGKPKHK